MRTPVIAGNWKMNLLSTEAVDLAGKVANEASDLDGVEVIVCPAFTVLRTVADALEGTAVELGAQNCYHEPSGAYTGEISPQMILDAGCRWAIIGHSERRQLFGEDDDFLNKKLHFALKSGLKVMFCIGETIEEREGGEMENVLRRQVTRGLKGLEEAGLSKLVLAYEPVWAIGTGKTATPEQAQEAHWFVRQLITDIFGGTLAEALRIQYGGSVKPENAAELLGQPDVDGALVGGASLKADSFAAIMKAAVQIV